MNRLITLITGFAMLAHAFAGCCWHSAPGQCCARDEGFSVNAADLGHHDHGHRHACNGERSFSSSQPEKSDLPQQLPTRHCEENSCLVIVLDTQTSAPQIDFHWVAGTAIVATAPEIDSHSNSSHILSIGDEHRSPLDRTLAYQVFLI